MGNVRFRVAVLLSILVMELTWVAELHAATPADIIVLHDGVEAFCATAGPFGFEPPYSFTGTCSTPPPPIDQCVPDATRTRMTSIVVGYSVQNALPTARDTLTFESIFGRGANTDPPPLKNFPGVSGTGPVLNWSLAHRYYSAKFHTPATGKIGDISLAFESNDSRGCKNTNGSPGPCGQPFYNVSISRQCNDYNEATAIVGKNPNGSVNVVSDGQPHFRATMGYSSDPKTMANNTDYYLNIRLADASDYWRTAFMTWRGSVTP